ncbi:two-component sensor histidine kinase [Massilia violaceinigra]|uniref:Oxygen sensor histidine kinase NreB n=1 Tax=Massilia violaceinigra TaxID=2045208 RepID=A0A2D2DQ63_9BURK|nr:sensor histidine kinase [Massilia violaceinigra]ATQ77083.1 two-component sensor histidine kinase [Massilia violaceinigra]
MHITPTAILALLWMLLIGWGFYALLQRHLRLDDQLSDKEAQLSIERHARDVAELALANTHLSLCQMTKQQETIRESERQRISRDIHDDLGQNLLALKIDLQLLHVSTTGAHPLITQKVDCMIGNLDNTIKSLRAIIYDLRPVVLEAGFQSAMEWQLSEFTRMHGIRHAFTADPTALDAPPDAERDAMLYRIVQEALSNVARHAHATEVNVKLHRFGDMLTLRVEDNGVGMVAAGNGRGCGLPGMRERVRAIGGCFAIDSLPGNGTMLSVSIPLTVAIAAH